MRIIQPIAGNNITRIIGSGRISIYNYIVPELQYLGNKAIIFYRDGSNNSQVGLAYRIISGATVGDQIELFDGVNSDPIGGDRMTYGVSHRDYKNRIWVGGLFENDFDSYSGREYGAMMYLYTYPNSCNSWKGGWDYWFFANGKPAGSGTVGSTNVKRRNLTQTMTLYVFSSCNGGPYKFVGVGGLGNPKGECNPWHMNIMPNGEPLVLTDYYSTYSPGNYGPRYFDYYYLSSNKIDGTHPSGTWYLSFRLKAPLASGGTYSRAISVVQDKTLIFYTSSGRLCTRVSTDNGRSWGEHTVIETLNLNTALYCQIDSIPNNGRTTDNFARLFIQRASSNSKHTWVPNGCSQYIYKVNVDTLEIDSRIVAHSGMSYPGYLCRKGDHRNGLTLFNKPLYTGESTTTSCGDPGFIQYWNENTNSYGIYDVYKDALSAPAAGHVGSTVRINNDNVIMQMGAGYFGTLEPDLYSGSTLTNMGKIIDIMDMPAGGCFFGLEILENIT